MKFVSLASAAVLALVAAQGCSAASSDDADSSESNLDYYSASAKEYFVTGTSTVTLESSMAQASEAEKENRAKELVALKSVAISWFLNQYLATKEDEDTNKNYGGFHAMGA